MTAKQLPPRPNLDQLKRQGQGLRGPPARTGRGARARFRALPALASASDETLDRAPLALHDAQSVIAREHGFHSWNALRDHVEAVTLELDAAVGQFLEAATDGRSERAERILALHPGIAQANFQTALVLGDAHRVDARLDRDPSLATKPGGPRGWEPLHYVCHTAMAHDSSPSGRAAGLAAIGRRLIALGADPNTRFPWLHHNVRRPVLWGASSVVRALPLVETLLDAGADPNDGVTLPLAASAGDIPVLEALLAHGANVDQAWASDGATSLYAILNWSRTPAGVMWLLERGADPNAVFAENGETPLHVVAREAMLACGFDPNRPDAGIGKTALHSAAMEGWPDAVRVLLAHGASVHVRDREFKGQPLIWAAEGSRQQREGRDFAAVGKLLLDAGSPVEWETGAEPAEGILEILEAWRRG